MVIYKRIYNECITEKELELELEEEEEEEELS
jgi:hypothetical protein